MSKLLLYWLLTVFQTAQPGYQYEFPRDHFAHPDYQTEWWYYTGNLQSANGRQFGFELTFFRFARYAEASHTNSPWETRDLYLAHLALSDITGGRFYHTERINRGGPGLAGVSLDQRRYWNGNWEVRWSESVQSLRAMTEQFSLQLEMTPSKPFVIHGRQGVSQKSASHGSHYISYPRLQTTGTVQIGGQNYAVTGLSWRDQEFFSGELDPNLAGWDWFSIHLSDGADLMLYRLRDQSGKATDFSAGTYIDAHGSTQGLSAGDFQLQPGKVWKSSETGASYPVEWGITIPKLSLQLSLTPQMPAQELVSKNKVAPSYWEGAVNLDGKQSGRKVSGQGYLEMTGYDRRLHFGSSSTAAGH